MNQIRKNNEPEQEIVTANFGITFGFFIRYLIMLLIMSIPIAISICSTIGSPNGIFDAIIPIIFFGVIFIGILIFMFFRLSGLKHSALTITNKRIKGKLSAGFIANKEFSYRLDEIDNVELGHILFAYQININFQQGKGPSAMSGQVSYGAGAANLASMVGGSTIRVSNVKNYQEVYDKLSELLLSVKNQIDLQTDIEMTKIDVESRKADALENIAKGANAIIINSQDEKVETTRHKGHKSTSYIQEIKELKELYDSGAITKEEYEQEKKEILDNN